jgi:hypothetical protein
VNSLLSCLLLVLTSPLLPVSYVSRAMCALLLLLLLLLVIQFERVLLARSGVLLLTWSDPSGALSRLRGSLHSSFPGACSKQSSIVHTSLFRIVETPASSNGSAESCQQRQQQQLDLQECSAAAAQLSTADVGIITAACEQWTQKVGPLSWLPDADVEGHGTCVVRTWQHRNHTLRLSALYTSQHSYAGKIKTFLHLFLYM